MIWISISSRFKLLLSLVNKESVNAEEGPKTPLMAINDILGYKSCFKFSLWSKTISNMMEKTSNYRQYSYHKDLHCHQNYLRKIF